MNKEAQNLKCRSTRQRRIILDQLKAAKNHPTAFELYEIIKQKLPSISLGTVYRNLEYLAKNGEIRRLEVQGRERRFDGDTGNHNHIRCLGCGRVDDLEKSPMGSFSKTVCKKCNYEIVGCNLEFIGYCPNCRKQK